ncbi:hypothetical protein D3C78_1481890 [compost metagenome]
MLLPSLSWMCWSARRARRVRRGSTTTNRAPRAWARRMRAPIMAWFSVASAPISRIRSALSISAMLPVIAPEPRVSDSPATEGLWQMRAQWSTLLLPSTARANFCAA